MEIHNYAAETFRKVTHSYAAFILGLTATMERKDGLHLLLMRFAPIVYRLSMAKARQLGIVADYEIYNLGIEMTREDKNYYRYQHGMFNDLFKKFDQNFDLAMRCSYKTTDDLRRRLARNLSTPQRQVTPEEVKKWAFMWAAAMRNRKTFFYNSPGKVKVVKEIFEKYNAPTIVFSETTKFADMVTEEIGKDCRSYHTQLVTELRQKKVTKAGKVTHKKVKMGTKKLRDEALELFNNGKIKCLSTARALNEGFSVDGVEIAILASYTSDVRAFIQRMGRAVRFVPGKKAKIIALYLKSFQDEDEVIRSQEEKWLRQAQRNQVGIRWIDSLDEINSERKMLL